MQDWDILGVLVIVILLAVLVFGVLPARREARRRKHKLRRVNSVSGDSGAFDAASFTDGGGGSAGADGGGD
jgi:uncharacterized membrane protein YgcG